MRTGRGRRLALLACCSLTVLTALTACGSSGGTGHGKIGLVAAENTWGDVAAQIGGDLVTVTSIISDPGADPHEYEADVRDAAALAEASLVLENGIGYDDFLRKLIAAAPDHGRTVLVVADVVGVHGSSANPHLWYSPTYVDTAARAIEAALATTLPSRASTFRANLARFLAREQSVVAVVDSIRAKYAGTAVAYTERVPGYLLDAAGLKLGTPASFSQAIEDGTDPGPADNAAFEKALSSHTVKVLIYNSQVTDAATKHLRELAIRSGVPVVGMTETLPSGEPDYQTWQADQARALLAALGG